MYSEFYILFHLQPIISAVVSKRGREQTSDPPGRNRQLREFGISIHQRQPTPPELAIRACPLLQARDYVHRELQTQ